MRIVLVILAALIVAGGTGFYVMQGLQPAAPEAVVQAAAPALREVYVPAQEIAVGTIITPERLSRMEVTEGAVTGQMIVADDAGATFLTGSVARQPLPQGVPIARSAIVQPGDRGFLAAVLPRGKRAITIPVDEIGSLSGLALPGDRVDLILTYSVSGDGEDAGTIRASETVMRNLRVLAFDQRLGSPKQAAEKEGEAEAAPVAKTATLEVSSQEAEMVTLAQTARHALARAELGARRRRRRRPRGKLAKTEAGPLETLVGKTAPDAAPPPPDPRIRRDLHHQGAGGARCGDPRHACPCPLSGPAPTE